MAKEGTVPFQPFGNSPSQTDGSGFRNGTHFLDAHLVQGERQGHGLIALVDESPLFKTSVRDQIRAGLFSKNE